jgi:hypothetical protein
MQDESKGGSAVVKGIFKDRPLNPRLEKKHSDCTVELIGFDFGPNKIQIQAAIVKELLEIDEEAAAKAFEGLLGRGTSTKFRDVDDGSLFAEILIPTKDFKVHEYWKYTFLHELGHSWFSIKFSPKDMESGYEDLFIDLVAICTFRKTLPPHKRVYREVRKHRTYFLTQQSKRFLGKELYKQILHDPEVYLRDLRQKI